MGLENLKSIFTEGIKRFEGPDLSSMPRPTLGGMFNSDLGTSTTPVTQEFNQTNLDSSDVPKPNDFNLTNLGNFPSPTLGDTYNPNFSNKEDLLPNVNTLSYDINPDKNTIKKGWQTSGETQNDIGLFNSVNNKYSYGHAVINKPLGYLNSAFGNDIFSFGNVTNNGSGYGARYNSIMEIYKGTREQSPSVYFANATDISEDRSIVQEQIPSFNNLVPMRGGSTSFPGNNLKLPPQTLGVNKLVKTGGWEMFYNSDHTYKGNAYRYSQFVSSDKLHLKSRDKTNRGKEPYIVSKIGRRLGGNRLRPLKFAKKDFDRLRQYYVSEAGLRVSGKRNAQGRTGTERGHHKYNAMFFAGMSQLAATVGRFGGAYGLPNYGFNYEAPWARTRYTSGDRAAGWSMNMNKSNVNIMFPDVAKDYGERFPGGFFTGGNSISRDSRENFPHGLKIKNPKKFGMDSADYMTSLPFAEKYDDLTEKNQARYFASNQTFPRPKDYDNFERGKYGMPLYFRDLRDGALLFFRAYLSGITENVSPDWEEHEYIGRSEPVYTYKRTTRDINFTLTLSVNTRDELFPIYQKLNRLTSMCYPEYAADTSPPFDLLKGGSKFRMKPPLIKFRMGDLFGSANNEMLGHLKSVNYTVPDSATWVQGLPGESVYETGFDGKKKDDSKSLGLQLPKMIQATIGFQVIHGTVPSLDMAKQTAWYANNDGGATNTFYGATDEPNIGPETTYVGNIAPHLGSNSFPMVVQAEPEEEEEEEW